MPELGEFLEQVVMAAAIPGGPYCALPPPPPPRAREIATAEAGGCPLPIGAVPRSLRILRAALRWRSVLFVLQTGTGHSFPGAAAVTKGHALGLRQHKHARRGGSVLDTDL